MTLLPYIAVRFEAEGSILDRALRFLSSLVDGQIDSAELIVAAAVLLGVSCGLLGAFIILRKQSMMGDAIGHAVLPGVCVGFLFAGSRSTPAMLLGALVAGLLAAALIGVLQRTTNLKSGECMGVVFTGFYGIGVVLLKWIQNHGLKQQAGLDKFLFGQIVGINEIEVICMAVMTFVVVLGVIVFWRKLKLTSFDELFAFSVGVPVKAMHYLLTGLLTVAIVVSIQAVGVVLVAAMLVTPAATAYLLTDRLHRMVMLSAMFGAAAGVLGAVVSAASRDLPTGSLIVLAASMLFGIVFLVSPRHGVLPRVYRVWQRRQKTQAENLIRTLFLILEKRSNNDRRFGVHDVAGIRQESPAVVRRLWKLAAARGWVDPKSRDPMIITDDGLEAATRVARNHRLWELFLTQEAKLASDHVHADAEYIEHILPPDVLRRLEQMLDHPTADPHGRPIPAATARGAV